VVTFDILGIGHAFDQPIPIILKRHLFGKSAAGELLVLGYSLSDRCWVATSDARRANFRTQEIASQAPGMPCLDEPPLNRASSIFGETALAD
jgi:hypothetical protein